MIKNFITCEKITDKNSHGEEESIDLQKVFRREDLNGTWDFALRVIMPPNSSVGVHEHGRYVYNS
jgi:hypothetical protein